MADSNVMKTELYPTVHKTLTQSDAQKAFRTNIDKYMALNINAYSSIGPSIKPIFGEDEANKLIAVTGLTNEQIRACLTKVSGNNSSWKNFNSPFNIAIVLAIRHFAETKNQEQLDNGLLYMIANIYAYIYRKYYSKFAPNEAAMAYTIADMSNRYKLKRSGSLLATLVDLAHVCYNTHKDRIKRCTDTDILKFVNDMTTRINAFMRKVRNELEENLKSGKYLQSEHEEFGDELYYEADSDSYAIDRITNKVLTNLVVNGPDRKLVELAAKNSSASVNILQTSILTLVSEENRDDIQRMIELLLSLYLHDNPNTVAIRDIGTNKFYIYCMRVYRQSNTLNKNIIEIKAILDRWIDDLELKKKVGTEQTLGNYRKALFTFFVYTIEKMN